MRRLASLGALVLVTLTVAQSARADRQRTDGSDEVVLKRLYPKQGRFEASVAFGWLLNPAFVDTALKEVSGRYFFNETWGLGLTLGTATTRDRGERTCVETFYNDPAPGEVGVPCLAQDGGEGLNGAKTANIGPAYPPVRELSRLVTVYGDYALAYGKLILLHGATAHFDLRLRSGLGLTMSRVYDERTYIRGQPDRPARGDMPPDGSSVPKPGVAPGEHDADGLLYGKEGRDPPRQERAPHLYLGLAEEVLFLRRFFLEGELAGYLMWADPGGVESVWLVRVGVGGRF